MMVAWGEACLDNGRKYFGGCTFGGDTLGTSAGLNIMNTASDKYESLHLMIYN